MGYRELRGATGAYKRLLGVIGRYNGLQLVPRGYIRLQGVSDGYNGQHWVTRGFWGLQEITGGYKGLHGLQMIAKNLFYNSNVPQILFLGQFCIKIKVQKISNF